LTDSPSRVSIYHMRPLRPITILAALIAAAVLAVPTAAGSDLSQTTVTASISDSPDPVTTGESVRYVTTLSNSGPATITHAALTLPLPGGMTPTTATASAGSCTTGSGQVTCTIGTLSAGQSVEVIVFADTSATGAFSVTAHWAADVDANDPHDYPATTSSTVVARTPDLVSGYALPAGDTLTTDPGTGATTTNPQVTTATVPATTEGTPAMLAESDASGPADGCGAGATCFGQISTITIGQTFTPGNPLRFVFLLDKSELPSGVKVAKIPMFHDGVLVPSCTGATGTASPDPCVVSRTKLKKTGDVQIVVLSSTNGRWRP
jgi:uncharacterized repeat protein (TIGR01451 family)